MTGYQMQVQVLPFLLAVRVQVTPTQDALPKPCLYLRRFFMWGKPKKEQEDDDNGYQDGED